LRLREKAVSALLARMPEFNDFLKKGEFDLDARYPWVKLVVLEHATKIHSLL
jgi:hypothetical protein